MHLFRSNHVRLGCLSYEVGTAGERTEPMSPSGVRGILYYSGTVVCRGDSVAVLRFNRFQYAFYIVNRF